MESPGAVTHPGWSSRNKVTGNSTEISTIRMVET